MHDVADEFFTLYGCTEGVGVRHRELAHMAQPFTFTAFANSLNIFMVLDEARRQP